MRLSKLREEQKRIKTAFKNYKNVYLYGAGVYAQALLKWLLKEKLKPTMLLVSGESENELDGIKIEKFNEDYIYDGILLIALSSKYHDEVLGNVAGHFKEVYVFTDDFFSILRMSTKLNLYEIGGYRKSSIEEIINKNQVKKTIILQRGGGMGDVLTLEPLCRALKNNGFNVGLMSNWECLFFYNNSIDFSSPFYNRFLEDSAMYISVELAHETRPLCHMLDAYLNLISQYIPGIEISAEARIPVYDNSLIRLRSKEIRKICINAEASQWHSRIYDINRMREFAKYLLSKGYEIYEIGTDRSNYLGVGKDCFGLELHDSVELMSKTDLYVGLDNGLMHLAQAIRLPIFVLFGCTCPLYRIHDWTRARVMWKNVNELACAGCYHRRRIPCVKTECMYEKCRCLDWSVEEVIYAFENLEYDSPPVLQKDMLLPIWP